MNEDGLATAIFVGMVLFVLAGSLAGFLLGRILASSLGWSGAKRMSSSLGLGALGVGCGVLAVIATFYESIWAPPPQVMLNVSSGFTKFWVIVLEDQAVSRPIIWQGAEIPFFGKKTVIEVPPSGIVRVRDLSGLSGRVDINARWSDGSRSTSQAGGPAPKSTGANIFVAFSRDHADGATRDEPPFGNSVELGAYIDAQERGAQ
jgi:hypothetical protein